MVKKIFIIVIAFTMLSMQIKVLQIKETPNFRLKYEKNIPKDEVNRIGMIAESRYVHYRALLGISILEKKDLYILASASRFRYESHSKIFDDGDYKLGKLYIVHRPGDDEGVKIKSVMSRIITRSLFEYIPDCPAWIAEAYSLYAGNDVLRFGDPVRLNLTTFADLGEEYNRAVDKKDYRDLYAKLGATIQFLIDRYGETKVESMLKKFKDGRTIEEAFETAFNEKMRIIEHAWIEALRNSSKER